MLDTTSDRVERELLVRTFMGLRPPDRLMRQLAAQLHDLDIAPGAVLFEAGTRTGQIFMVAEGTIDMIADGEAPWTLDGQSMMGIVDALLDRPHARTARARTRVLGASVRFTDYLEILEDNFDFAKGAMERACRLTHELALRLAPDVFPPPGTRTEIVEKVAESGRPLEMIERLIVLSRSEILRHAPVQPMVSLATLAEEEVWPEGSVIFERGRPMEYLRIVACGLVAGEDHETKTRGTFGPGDLLGFFAALGFDTYQYRMVAKAPTRTLRLRKEDLFDVMEDHFGVARTVLAATSRENDRLRRELGRHPAAGSGASDPSDSAAPEGSFAS